MKNLDGIVERQFGLCTRWLLYLCACLLFSYSFWQRVNVSVMTDLLMADFSVDAATIGHFGSVYYFAYAGLQIVAVMLVDWFGVLESLTSMALGCFAGSLLYAVAPSLWVAAIGRGLIGASTAATFITIIKICTLCFPQRKSLLIGMGVFSGFVGSIVGQSPIASLLESGVRWRTIMLASTVVPLAVFAVFSASWARLRLRQRNGRRSQSTVVPLAVLGGASAVLPGSGCSDSTCVDIGAPAPGSVPEGSGAKVAVPDGHTQPQQAPRPHSALTRLKRTVCNPSNVVLSLYGFFNVATLNTFASLWAPPYLTAAHGMGRERAAVMASAVLFGWGLGAPLLGWANDHLPSSRVLAASSLAGASSMLLALYVDNLPLGLMFAFLFGAGLATPIPVIFAAVVERNDVALQSVAAAVINTCIMMNGAVFQPLVGSLLAMADDGTADAPGSGSGESEVETYSAAAYMKVMAVYPATYALSFVCALWLVAHPPPVAAARAATPTKGVGAPDGGVPAEGGDAASGAAPRAVGSAGSAADH